MAVTVSLDAPPLPATADGRTRRVGVELEFARLSVRGAATVVQQLFGGRLVAYGHHRFRIEDSEIGPFEIKLDTRFLHSDTPTDLDPELPSEHFGTMLLGWVGDIAAAVVPCEIVCPPLVWTALGRVDLLVQRLGEAGAAGTGENFAYAFGLHLNPEAAALDVAYLLRVLRAYLLMSDWLRDCIRVDMTRQLLSVADPFPSTYMLEVLDPAYAPDMPGLIDHYIAANPTRNRELDLLPLFAWIDPERVRGALDDPAIRARPTFHWRLPNARIGDARWSVATEWNRWVRVETLAENGPGISSLSDAYRRYYDRVIPGDWAAEVAAWLRQ